MAREAAALVVVDDDFSSIVAAIRLGRRIYDNIRKATAYALAVHVPIAGMSVLPVLFGWPLIIMPVHLIFMELVTDPACSIVFEMEPEEPGLMRRGPRAIGARLFTLSLVTRSLLQGAGGLAIATAMLWIARSHALPEEDVRTWTFSTLIVTTLALAVSDRSFTRAAWVRTGKTNRAFRILVAGATTLLAIVLYVPFFRSLFHLAPAHGDDLLVIVVAGIATIGWMELVKRAMPATP